MNRIVLVLILLTLLILITLLTFFILKKKKKKIISDNKDEIVQINNYEENEGFIINDLPLLIQKVNPSIITTGRLIEPNNKLMEYSTELLKLAKTNTPYLSKGKEVFEVVFSESIQEEMKKGSITLLNSVQKEGYHRAIAVNGSGKIVENANLKVQKYNPAQLRALAMNTLTVVVSQEHLQEIRKELENIKLSLDRLLSMKKNEYFGKAKGSYDYLKRAYSIYLNDEINNKVINQLESIYRENISSIYSLIKDLDYVTVQTSILKKKVWIWQSNKEVNNLANIIKEYTEYEELLNLYFMNVNGCLKLMELYGDSPLVIENSYENVNVLIESFKSNKKQFLDDLNSYLREFKTRLTTDNYLIEKQNSIKKEIGKVESKLNNKFKRTLSAPPEKLYLSVEDNNIVSVYKA